MMQALVRDLPLDYRVDMFLVNALNYGVAQNRERIIMVGNRCNRVSSFPGPTHGPGLRPYFTLRDALHGLADDDPMILDFSKTRKKYQAMVPPGGDWRDLPAEIAQLVVPKSRGGKTGFMRRLSWDEPTPTILCYPNHAATALCHPIQTRTLTAKEVAHPRVP